MRRGSSKTALLLVVAALVAVAIGVFLLLDPTGTRGTDQGSRGASPAGAPPAASVDAPGSGRAGAQAPVVATAETDGSAAREVALDASLLADTEIVRGRLVVVTTGKPPRDAVVAVRTGEDAIDYAALWRALGGEEAVERLWRSDATARRVRELGGWRPTYTARAEADGSFQVRVPRRAFRFAFEVTAEGAALLHPEWHRLGSRAVAEGLVLLLEEATTITGRVTDEEGRPIAGGSVRIDPRVDLGPTRPNFARLSEVTADADGRFRFPGVPGLEVEVAAVAEGFAPATVRAVASRPGTTVDVTLRLPREIRFEAQIVDASGRGVEGVAVSLRGTSQPLFVISRLGCGAAFSDTGGHLRWTNLLAGRYGVQILADGALPREQPEQVELPRPAGAPPLRWTLVPGHALAGRVVDGEGRPVEEARVEARIWIDPNPKKSGDFRPGAFREALTGPDGAFRLTGLGEGPHRVRASVEDRSSVEKAPVPQDAEDVLLELPGPTGIAGVVRDDATGAPIESFVTASLSLAHRRQYSRWVPRKLLRPHRDPAGAFARLGLEPDTYELRVTAEGYTEARASSVVVRPGEITHGVEVRLVREAILRGRVTIKESGEPFGGALVEATRSADASGRLLFATRTESVVTDADGTFEFGGLEDGSYQVVASHPLRCEDSVGGIDARPGTILEVPPLSLASGGSLEGIARGADGVPYRGGLVNARLERARDPDDRRVVRARGARLGDDGAFRFEGCLPGTWRVEAMPAHDLDGRDAAMRRTIRGTAEVAEGAIATVLFDPPPAIGCTLRGRVTRAGTPMRDTAVVLRMLAKEGGGRDLHAPLDDDGEYRIEHVSPGAAILIGTPFAGLAGGSGADFRVELTIPDAAEHRFDVDLAGSGRIHGRVTRRANGEGLSGLSVRAHATASPSDDRLSARSGAGLTDAKGDFEITGLGAGAYVVTVDPQEEHFGPREPSSLAARSVGPLPVAEGASVRADVALDEGAIAVIEVLDADGRPLPDATVSVRPTAGGPTPDVPSARTDGSGVARIAAVPAGSCVARASVDGRIGDSDPFDATPGAEIRVTIRMPPVTRLRIVARGPDGSIVDAPQLNLWDAQGREVAFGIRGSDVLLAPLGPGTLTVRAKGYAAATVAVTVGASTEQIVEVKLAVESKSEKQGE